MPTGRALEGNTVKIIDERANELAEGEIGNIAIGGKLVFDGYLKSSVEPPFLTSPKGYRLLLTGDKGFKRVLDGCAYIKVTGRNKETINFRGLRYYFTDLENMLRPVVNLDFYISDASIFDITINRDTSIFIALESVHSWKNLFKIMVTYKKNFDINRQNTFQHSRNCKNTTY